MEGGDPLEMVQRGGEAEIQSDIWPNLIFSGTNIELWRFAVQILNFISIEEQKCLLYTDIWALDQKFKCFFLFREICLLIEKRKQEDICDLIWQILQILDQIQFYMEKLGSSSEI